MPKDTYQIQNILHYSRRSSQKNQNGITLEAYSRRDGIDDNLDSTQYNDANRNRVTEIREMTMEAGCSCDVETDDAINILHKKCPLIALAQQQLQRVLDETDKLLYDNTRCCRSVYDFLIICKENLWDENKNRFLLIVTSLLALVLGLIFGAASCGTNLRRFNSPILSCIDNYFLPDTIASFEESFLAVI